MIRSVMVIEGSPKGMVKNFRKFVKAGLYKLVGRWHEKTMPLHFKPRAKKQYDYAPRSIKYTRYKRKRRPSAGPLEFSGKSMRMLTQSVKISGTAKRASGTMRAPRHFWMKPAGHPDKPDELTRVTKTEATAMAKRLNEEVTKKLNALKDRQVIR